MISTIKKIFKINWFLTLKINFYKLPFRDALKLPIIVHGKLTVTDLSGSISIKCPIKTGLFEIGTRKEMITTSSGKAQFTLSGNLIINGPCEVAQDVAIVIQKNGSFTINEGVFIGNNARLMITNDVFFGKFVRFAYDCQLISTNFHYMIDMNTKLVKRKSKGHITINDYCWIGNSSTIMQGVILPTKTIVASHSLVNKDFSNAPEYPLIGGMPAKVIASGRTRIYNSKTEKEINLFFENNPDAAEMNASGMEIFL